MLGYLVIHMYRKKLDSISLLEHSFGLSTLEAGIQSETKKEAEVGKSL